VLDRKNFNLTRFEGTTLLVDAFAMSAVAVYVCFFVGDSLLKKRSRLFGKEGEEKLFIPHSTSDCARTVRLK
jgi:hypothetical protein